MALNTTKGATKGKAKPKVAVAKGAAKAVKGKAKPATESKVKFKQGDEVEFVKYAEEAADDALFSPGDRLRVVEVGKNDDNVAVLSCVKAEDYDAYQDDNDSVAGEELSPAEVKKAEKLPVDPFKFNLAGDEALDAFIAEQGGDDGDLLTAARAAVEGINHNTFMLGGVLTKLYYEQAFRQYGEEGEYADILVDDKPKFGSGWDKFCRENFQMDGRKGEAMIRVYRGFNGLGDILDLEEISADKGIGYVKLNAMAGVITKDNAVELVEKARELNVGDFKNEIRENYVGSDSATTSQSRDTGPRMKRISYKFSFFADQAEGVKIVTEAVAKQLGVDPEKNLDQVMEHIIMMFAADHLSEGDQKKARTARKGQINELKKQGGESWKERQQAMVDMEARLAGGGDGEGEPDADGGETETEEADAAPVAKPKVKVKTKA